MQMCRGVTYQYLTHIHTGINMESNVLGFLLLLLCWIVVGGQTCQLTCKFGHWHYSVRSTAISP